MNYITVEHGPHDLQRLIAIDTILAMCARAFGRAARVAAVRELGGGEINSTFLVDLANGQSVILRVAPPADAPLAWHEVALMRREHSIQPYLAPIAPLIPKR